MVLKITHLVTGMASSHRIRLPTRCPTATGRHCEKQVPIGHSSVQPNPRYAGTPTVDRWLIPLFLEFQPSFWWCRISSIHSSIANETDWETMKGEHVARVKLSTHTPAIHQQFWKIYHCPTVGGLNPIFTQNRDGHHQSVKEMGTASKLLQMPILDGLYVDHCRFSCMYPQCSSCITKFLEYTAFLVGFTLNIKVKPGLNTWKALSMSLLDYMFELCFTSYLYLCFYVHAPFRFTPWSTRPLFEKYILNNKPSSCLPFQQINVVLGYKLRHVLQIQE